MRKYPIGKRALRRLSPGQVGLNKVFGSYRCSAKRRGLAFLLTREDVFLITSQNCAYCKAPPEQVSYLAGTTASNSVYIYNGIDRIDSSLGYIIENCAPACFICNRAKANMTESEFRNWVFRVYTGISG